MRPALEEMLEVDKLLEAKQAANASVANDSQLETLKDKQASPEEPEITDDGSSDMQMSDGSGSTDTPEEEQEPDEEFNEATEQIANLKYDISVESWDSVTHYSKQAIGAVGTAIGYIANLGIHYTPIIASKLYKGVSVVFGMMVRQLFKSIYVVSKYMERRANSINNMKESIAGLKSSIEQIKQQEKVIDLTDFKYSQQKTIQGLKIGESVDFTSNLKVLDLFLKETIIALDKHVKDEIASVRRIITMATSGSATVPNTQLTIPELSSKMITGTISGYEVKDEFIKVSHYNQVLPGDVVFMTVLPDEVSNEMEQISKAYNNSKIMFGIDQKGYRQIDTTDHMTIEQLSEFVDSLDGLCLQCEQHQSFYSSIKKLKLDLRFTFRDYFKMLVSGAAKVSIKDSLVNLVYLKSIFVDRVYLVGAMDVHDYTAKTITTGISFARDHVKRLQ